MIRRILLGLGILIVTLVLGPPLWFTLFPGERPTLPEPGRAAHLADGTSLHVLAYGEGSGGRPIVLVHSLPGTAYDWGDLPEFLAAGGHRVFADDRKSYGWSDARAEGEAHTIDANAKELAMLLEALELEDAVVVGWSYGGAMLTRVLRLDDSRIGRAVFLATGPPDPEAEEEELPLIARLLLSTPGRAWVARVPPLSEALIRLLGVEAFSEQPMPDDWVPRVRANLARPGARRAHVQEGVEFDASVLDSSAVTIPTLVILGVDDRFVPFDYNDGFYEEEFAHAERLDVEGGSHMLPITHAPLLAERILAFAK